MWSRFIQRLFRPTLRPEAEQRRLDQQTAQLALYDLTFCPYCIRVRMAVRQLGLRIERRDIDDARWGDELVAEGGKFQAPCLRIGNPDHPPQWLYESSAIIHYLQQRFSEDNL